MKNQIGLRNLIITLGFVLSPAFAKGAEVPLANYHDSNSPVCRARLSAITHVTDRPYACLFCTGSPTTTTFSIDVALQTRFNETTRLAFIQKALPAYLNQVKLARLIGAAIPELTQKMLAQCDIGQKDYLQKQFKLTHGQAIKEADLANAKSGLNSESYQRRLMVATMEAFLIKRTDGFGLTPERQLELDKIRFAYPEVVDVGEEKIGSGTSRLVTNVALLTQSPYNVSVLQTRTTLTNEEVSLKILEILKLPTDGPSVSKIAFDNDGAEAAQKAVDDFLFPQNKAIPLASADEKMGAVITQVPTEFNQTSPRALLMHRLMTNPLPKELKPIFKNLATARLQRTGEALNDLCRANFCELSKLSNATTNGVIQGIKNPRDKNFLETKLCLSCAKDESSDTHKLLSEVSEIANWAVIAIGTTTCVYGQYYGCLAGGLFSAKQAYRHVDQAVEDYKNFSEKYDFLMAGLLSAGQGVESMDKDRSKFYSNAVLAIAGAVGAFGGLSETYYGFEETNQIYNGIKSLLPSVVQRFGPQAEDLSDSLFRLAVTDQKFKDRLLDLAGDVEKGQHITSKIEDILAKFQQEFEKPYTVPRAVPQPVQRIFIQKLEHHQVRKLLNNNDVKNPLVNLLSGPKDGSNYQENDVIK